jgi:hypothetical protein
VRLLAFLLPLVALAACEAPSPVDAPRDNSVTPEIKIANDYHEQLMRLAPRYQRLAVKRAIVQSSLRCTRVDNAGYQQEYRNMRMWVGHCDPENKSFAVYLAPNGDVQVRNCADAGELALPRCQGLPPPLPDSAPGASPPPAAGAD